MEQLVFINDGRPVTDSLTVAEVFEKEHKHVLRDIRELGCSDDFRQSNFGQSKYKNSQGHEMTKYIISEQGFTLLAMGYTGEKAMTFKERYIAEFEKMRKEQKEGNVKLPMSFKDALISLLDQIEENEKLQTNNLMLEQRVGELEPKATYLDLILKSTSTVTVTQIAKDYGLTGQALNAILHEEGLQYKINDQWLLYRAYHDKGYTRSVTMNVTHNSGESTVKMTTRWT